MDVAVRWQPKNKSSLNHLSEQHALTSICIFILSIAMLPNKCGRNISFECLILHLEQAISILED